MNSPRLRIAPSPTGAMHIGTARSALFNWLLARRYNGQFILRIEDTDKERSTKEFERDILAGLRWLGLTWDEGPEIGGPYGPYYQSKRTVLYTEALEKLLKSGAAFHCFHTKEELAQERDIQIAAEGPLIHRCDHKNFSAAERESRLKNGEKSVLRFNTPKETVEFTDLIRGKISTDTDLLGDFVIAKSLREPLYNLAAVIDDAAMHISHVLRGEEHISNTPKQLLLYRALLKRPPAFGHLPLILAPDRSKMSKRFGATAVSAYREAGYLPEALINFIALLGWNPGGEQELFTVKELIARFSLERIRKSGSVFAQERLDWFNGKFIRALDAEIYLNRLQPFIDKLDFISSNNSQYYTDAAGERWSKEQINAILKNEQSRLKHLADIGETIDFYFRGQKLGYNIDLLKWKDMSLQAVVNAIETAKNVLADIPESQWLKETIEQKLMPIAEKADNRGQLLWPLRAALTGRKQSPGPFEVAYFLGKKRALARLEWALTIINNRA